TEAVFAPKVQGLLNLKAAFGPDQPESTILFSALSGVLGGPGQAAYAAANAWLDAYAEGNDRSGARVVAIAWDAWKETGMAARAARTGTADRGVPTDHPLFFEKSVGRDVASYTTALSTEHWIIGEHRIEGRAVLPGTGYLDLAVSAFQDWTGTDGV